MLQIMTRVVVTGGSGKLGDAVVADLVSHGYDVVNVDLVPSRTDRCPYTRVDLTDYGQTVQVLTGVDDRYHGVDAVVHLAAIPAPGQATDATVFHTNMSSTYNVFKAAATVGIRKVVWASSETLLGLPFATPPDYLPVDEDTPARPETSYALSKLAGEAIAVEFCRWHPGLSIVALRFSNVMRPGDYADFAAFQEDPRFRAWNAWGYIDARDGAQAVRLALDFERPGYEMFIIANADTVMMTPSAELAAQVFPDVPVTRELTTHETLLSIDKARRLLGYQPEHSWRDELP